MCFVWYSPRGLYGVATCIARKVSTTVLTIFCQVMQKHPLFKIIFAFGFKSKIRIKNTVTQKATIILYHISHILSSVFCKFSKVFSTFFETLATDTAATHCIHASTQQIYLYAFSTNFCKLEYYFTTNFLFCQTILCSLTKYFLSFLRFVRLPSFDTPPRKPKDIHSTI